MGQEKRKLEDDAVENNEQRESKQAKPDVSDEKHANGDAGDTEPERKFDLLFTGSTKWTTMRRSSVPVAVKKRGGSDTGEDFLGPTRLVFNGLEDVHFTNVYSGPAAAHSILIDDKGMAYGVGRNEHGQLGVPDVMAITTPEMVEIGGLKKGERIVSAACGRAHTILVTSEGAAYAAGANGFGQLAGGGQDATSAKWSRVRIRDGEHIIGASAGGNFSAFCTKNGSVYTAGSAQYGQLGLGSTGESIVSAGKVGYAAAVHALRVDGFGDAKITAVASGTNHSIALDDKGHVWSWGWGAYGRLGHKSTKDELVPRKVSTLANTGLVVTAITCGDKSSIAHIGGRNLTYKWGITKLSGEATMYPKPDHNLTGWEIRSMSAGPTSTAVAAETSLITWGPSPCFGELGYGEGEQKSSTKPQKVEAVEGLTIQQVAMGLSYTFMIVDVTKDEDKKMVDELEVHQVEEEE